MLGRLSAPIAFLLNCRIYRVKVFQVRIAFALLIECARESGYYGGWLFWDDWRLNALAINTTSLLDLLHTTCSDYLKLLLNLVFLGNLTTIFFKFCEEIICLGRSRIIGFIFQHLLSALT